MQKILLKYLSGILLIQDVFSAGNSVVSDDFSNPIQRRLNFRSSSEMRASSAKRVRDNSDSINLPNIGPIPQRNESIPRSSSFIFEFSDDHKNTLRQYGISDTQINRIELLQTIFFRSPHGDRFNPRSYLSENELDSICNKLNSEEVRSLVFTLKSLYDQKIPLSEMSPNTIYTPAARLSCIDSDGPKAKEISHILTGCSGIHVEHVTGHTFAEDETPETPEERAVRHALKEQLFKTLEAQRGISESTRLSELSEAEHIWSNYFEYLRLRVQTIDQQRVQKIKCGEIEETFQELVGSSYSLIKVGDCVLYFRKEEINLTRTNLDKKNNIQLLSESLAPIGADGEPMELHHLTRRHPGVIVLMTQAFHQKYAAPLHLRSEKHMHQPQPVDRAIFASWKKAAFAKLLNALVPITATTNEFDPAIRLSF